MQISKASARKPEAAASVQASHVARASADGAAASSSPGGRSPRRRAASPSATASMKFAAATWASVAGRLNRFRSTKGAASTPTAAPSVLIA
jgi:hypothetical protein